MTDHELTLKGLETIHGKKVNELEKSVNMEFRLKIKETIVN